MSPPAPTPDALREGLRRVRLSVVLGLAACAGLVALSPAPAADPARPSLPFVMAALVLVLASILAHQASLRPGRGVRDRVRLAVASAAMAGGIGLVGVVAWYALGDARMAIGFILGGGILALRPQPVRVPKTRAGRRGP